LYISPGRRVRTDTFDVHFTEEEEAVINGPPVWAANPPQREEHSSDRGYVVALREYARRVIVGGVMGS